MDRAAAVRGRAGANRQPVRISVSRCVHTRRRRDRRLRTRCPPAAHRRQRRRCRGACRVEGPDVISSEAAFAAWAPDGVLWSDWAKPAPFVHAGGVLVNDPIDESTLPRLPLGLDSRSAVIVDLPGEEAVYAGVALAARGFRPVALFNGTNGPSPVVDVAPIVEALGRAAEGIRTRPLEPEAAPAFLLDSRRQSGTPA